MRAIIVLALLTLSLLPRLALADDVAIAREMLEYAEDKEWASARRAAHQAKNPLIVELYNWLALRAGQGGFADYERFLSERPTWPGMEWLQKAGEKHIPLRTEPERVIAFFELLGPQSDYGLTLLMRAYHDLGQDEAAADAMRRAAQEIVITPLAMAEIEAIYPDLVRLHRFAHVDHLLLEGEYQAARAHLDALSGRERNIARARILMQADESGIEEALGELTRDDLNSGGVALDRLRFRRAHRDHDRAVALLLGQSHSREALGAPRYWAEDREDLARDLMWDGHPEKAYRAASQHFLYPDDLAYSRLEFLAGFIALEFLHDAKLARGHFENFKSSVNTPISNGRAGYWLGRAGDPRGYAFAAKWQTSFYGQLAAELAGVGFDDALIEGRPPSWSNRKFLESDIVHAGLIFAAADEPLLAHRFLAHASEELDAADAEALGHLALKMDLPYCAVTIGKNLADRGEVIPHSYYPLPDFIDTPILTPQSLAFAVMRQESEFYSRARSHAGAVGLMQLLPETAADMAAREGLEYAQSELVENPGYNVRLGAAYLDEMLTRFNGALPLVAAGYNAGPGRAERWLKRLGPMPRDIDGAVRWIEMIPFDETRNYVQRVLEATFLYDAKLRGGFGHYKPSQLLVEIFPRGKVYPPYVPFKREKSAAFGRAEIALRE